MAPLWRRHGGEAPAAGKMSHIVGKGFSEFSGRFVVSWQDVIENPKNRPEIGRWRTLLSFVCVTRDVPQMAVFH